MTDAELRQLAQIERQLLAESPDLRRLFDDAEAKRYRRRRQGWWWAGAGTLLLSVALLAAGLGAGLPGLAVTALCPPIAFGLLLLGCLLFAPGALGSGRAR